MVHLVLRIFRQVLSASIGKRTLVSVAAAIIPLAVLVVLVAISFRNELGNVSDYLERVMPHFRVKSEDCWIFSPGPHPLRVVF